MTPPTPALAAFGVRACDVCGQEFRPSVATLREYEAALVRDPDLALYCFTCEDYLARRSGGGQL